MWVNLNSLAKTADRFPFLPISLKCAPFVLWTNERIMAGRKKHAKLNEITLDLAGSPCCVNDTYFLKWTVPFYLFLHSSRPQTALLLSL